MHDNDPNQTSLLCLISAENEETLKVITWPPQSPVLNPSELLWEELDRRIKRRGELKENVQYQKSPLDDIAEGVEQYLSNILKKINIKNATNCATNN